MQRWCKAAVEVPETRVEGRRHINDKHFGKVGMGMDAVIVWPWPTPECVVHPVIVRRKINKQIRSCRARFY